MKILAALFFSFILLPSAGNAQDASNIQKEAAVQNEQLYAQPLSGIMTPQPNNLVVQNEPLKIGVGGFYPPFIMQGANQELYGFDIEMMVDLCVLMHRSCIFQSMRFRQLIPALINKQIDVAVNAIAITQERSKLVSFSMPYLLSYSRFVTNHNYSDQPFTLQLLNGKRIGVGLDSVFNQQIREMKILNPKIVEFSGKHSIEEMMDALNRGQIDFALIDNPSATYWSANLDHIEATGKPIMYGYGLGIAVNHDNIELLQSINDALLHYEHTDEYLNGYKKYMMQF